MGLGTTDYRVLLVEELSSRRRRNPSYSLTSFAKSVGISPAGLSQIINGKRPVSQKTIRKLTEKCFVTAPKKEQFLNSLVSYYASSNGSPSDSEYEELSIETFRAISDCYPDAIRNLGNLRRNSSDPFWIARQLSISPAKARIAFQRLLRLGLIRKKGRGFEPTPRSLSIPTHARDAVFRDDHFQTLSKAAQVLDSPDAPLELYSSMTMAVDERCLEEARRIIREFRRKICRLLENGERTRVYTLAIQLFPISKGEVS